MPAFLGSLTLWRLLPASGAWKAQAIQWPANLFLWSVLWRSLDWKPYVGVMSLLGKNSSRIDKNLTRYKCRCNICWKNQSQKYKRKSAAIPMDKKFQTFSENWGLSPNFSAVSGCWCCWGLRASATTAKANCLQNIWKKLPAHKKWTHLTAVKLSENKKKKYRTFVIWELSI